jgi:hypothetical protein
VNYLCVFIGLHTTHFGRIAEKYKLVKHEEENPLTEEIDNNEFTNKKNIVLVIAILVVGCKRLQL